MNIIVTIKDGEAVGWTVDGEAKDGEADECCGECRFWRHRNISGHCHKRSPQLNLTGVWQWPQTYHFKWCGDFERKDRDT